jgi:hypothetical protein
MNKNIKEVKKIIFFYDWGVKKKIDLKNIV